MALGKMDEERSTRMGKNCGIEHKRFTVVEREEEGQEEARSSEGGCILAVRRIKPRLSRVFSWGTRLPIMQIGAQRNRGSRRDRASYRLIDLQCVQFTMDFICMCNV